MLLPKECYGESLSGRGSNTQSNQEVNTLPLNYCEIAAKALANFAIHNTLPQEKEKNSHFKVCKNVRFITFSLNIKYVSNITTGIHIYI